MHTLLLILQSLLALGFMLLGLSKLASEPAPGAPVLIRPRLRYLAGIAELVGAVGLIAGIWNPTAAIVACLWLGLTMALVLWESVARIGLPLARAGLPAALLVLCLSIAVFHWSVVV